MEFDIYRPFYGKFKIGNEWNRLQTGTGAVPYNIVLPG